MTANPPKISLLFTGDEFCSTIIVIASPPPMAFFGIRNRRLSPSAYRQNSPPTAKNTTATFRFPDSGMVCLPQPSACAYACGFPSCFMIWLSLLAGILAVAAAFAVFGYYRWRSYREFGGITGDTAGYFLTLCEGAMAVAAAVSVLI